MARPRRANPEAHVPVSSAEDYQRLRAQTRLWQSATSEVLDQIGLQAGMSALDVGSGPGTVMRLMADRVGPAGVVTGIDIDSGLGARALQELRAEGGARFELIEADVLKLDALAGAPFDVTFCRGLLMQMRDPVAVLEKMHAWTRPGGVLVAQEFDFGSIAVEPTCPAMGEFNRVFEGVFRGHGRNMRAGRQLPAQFEAAGVGIPDGTHAAVHYLPLSELAGMMIGVYDNLYAAGVEFGLADPARAELFRQDMAEAGADGRYYCLTPVLIAAWKHSE